MQREVSATGHGGAMKYDNLSSPACLGQSSKAAFDFNSLYSSTLFSPNLPLIGHSAVDDGSHRSEEMTSRFLHSQLLIDQQYHQDLIDRHAEVLAHLRDASKQALALRQENVNLKMANLDLNNRLTLLLNASSNYAASCGASSSIGSISGLESPVDGITGRMGVGFGLDESTSEGHSWEDMGGTSSGDRHESPTSVMDSSRTESSDVNRVLLPKSISVRSRGYMKTVQACGSNKPQNRTKTGNEAQTVYVKGGGKKEEQPLALEVYNQGMFKTELCNKWQETGACPYGDNCQFAHGLEELRPVLRHPRYKTEVCRMVLNGDHCPYGHRCHFRHTLTHQEKLIRALNSRFRVIGMGDTHQRG